MSSKTTRLRRPIFPASRATQSYVGQECEREILDQRWRFDRWELHILDEWTEWARSQLPDPIERAAAVIEKMMVTEENIEDSATLARRNKIKDEIMFAATKQANSYLAFNSPEVQSLIQSPRGAAQLICLLLKKYQPNVTADEAFRLVQAMPDGMMREIMEITAGHSLPAEKNSSAPASRGESTVTP